MERKSDVNATGRTLIEWSRVGPVYPGILEDLRDGAVPDDLGKVAAGEEGLVEAEVEHAVEPAVDGDSAVVVR